MKRRRAEGGRRSLKDRLLAISYWLLGYWLLAIFITAENGVGQQKEANPKLKLPQGMVLIPAGEFIMGDDEASADEKPKHKVFLDAYYIDKLEVTNSQYYAFWMADGGEKSPHTSISYGEQHSIGNWPEIVQTKPNFPVVGVSWDDALAYAKWANKRLPAEAEWEKAARGTEKRSWPWGHAFSLMIQGATTHANIWDGKDGYDNGLAPVGSYPTGASPYGVLDMAGNVWEWVSDWYSDTYYYRSPQRNPKGPASGSWRVIRGGSWADGPEAALCISRSSQYPSLGTSFIGIRLAKDTEK